MILFVVFCAITAVVAMGFQVAGMCIPMWWKYTVDDRQYYFGLWKVPWKTEQCHRGKCVVSSTDGELWPGADYPMGWLVYVHVLEILGSCLGGVAMMVIVIWLWCLGRSKICNKIINGLKITAILLQSVAGITTATGIFIVIGKAKRNELLWATWLCLTGAILFFIGAVMTLKFPKMHIKWGSRSGMENEVFNATPTPMSTMSHGEYSDPPPPYHIAVSEMADLSASGAYEMSKSVYI